MSTPPPFCILNESGIVKLVNGVCLAPGGFLLVEGLRLLSITDNERVTITTLLQQEEEIGEPATSLEDQMSSLSVSFTSWQMKWIIQVDDLDCTVAGSCLDYILTNYSLPVNALGEDINYFILVPPGDGDGYLCD